MDSKDSSAYWMRLILLLLVTLFTTHSGCKPNTKGALIVEGIVISNPASSASFLGAGITAEIPVGYFPVSDAVVYLAQTNDPGTALPGLSTTSDKDGLYRINLVDLPVSTDADGYYCLVVKKVGYVSLIHKELSLGVFSNYMKNTIRLRLAPVQTGPKDARREKGEEKVSGPFIRYFRFLERPSGRSSLVRYATKAKKGS